MRAAPPCTAALAHRAGPARVLAALLCALSAGVITYWACLVWEASDPGPINRFNNALLLLVVLTAALGLVLGALWGPRAWRSTPGWLHWSGLHWHVLDAPGVPADDGNRCQRLQVRIDLGAWLLLHWQWPRTGASGPGHGVGHPAGRATWAWLRQSGIPLSDWQGMRVALAAHAEPAEPARAGEA